MLFSSITIKISILFYNNFIPFVFFSHDVCVHVCFLATSQYTLPKLWGGWVPTSGSGYS